MLGLRGDRARVVTWQDASSNFSGAVESTANIVALVPSEFSC